MTLVEIIDDAAERMSRHGLVFGHGTDNAWSEACWMAAHVLGLAPDFDPAQSDRELEEDEQRCFSRLLEARISTRKPLAYLTGQAWFAGLEFKVSEKVLVPRSPLAELIGEGFEPWLLPDQLQRALDVGTGSGCIAVALAWHWPELMVDALDISPEALAVARANVAAHGLDDRVRLIESDLLSALGDERYDLVLANPPYVPADSMASLPAEYCHEPTLGLAAGADGLDLVRRLLVQLPAHLHPHGIVILEVGEAAEALDELLAPISPVWLEFAGGGEGVCLLDYQACLTAAEIVAGKG